jgi:hypothetical protein
MQRLRFTPFCQGHQSGGSSAFAWRRKRPTLSDVFAYHPSISSTAILSPLSVKL